MKFTDRLTLEMDRGYDWGTSHSEGLHGEGGFQTFAGNEPPSLSFSISCHPIGALPITPFLPFCLQKKTTKYFIRPRTMAFVVYF
jgi:hypothetical protein